jgi:ATP-binding cassette subfamily B protein
VLSSLLRAHLRPYRRAVALVVLLDLVQVAATLTAPGLNAAMVDHGMVDGDTGYVLRAGALLLLVGLVQATAAVGALSLGAGTSAALGRDLREVALGPHSAAPGPGGAARARDDVRQVQAVALTAFVVGVVAPVMGVGATVLALRRGLAAWAAWAAWPVRAALPAALPAEVQAEVPAEVPAAVAAVTVAVAAVAMAAVVARAVRVRAGSPGKPVDGPLGWRDAELFDLSVRVGRLTVMIFPALLLTMNVLGGAMLWWGDDVVDGDDGAARAGDLVALLGYLELILVSVLLATAALGTTPYARAAARRIRARAVRPPYPVARRSAGRSRQGAG